MNKITLHTEDYFDSCHRLRNYEGKCCNYHGHTWKLEIWAQGVDNQKDEIGILFDFGEVKKIKELLDHKDLNEMVPYFSDVNPTAENISEFILNILKLKYINLDFRVKLFETYAGKKTWCQRQTDNFDINYL